MYTTDTINNIKPQVTISGFSAVTITLPEIKKVPGADLFTLPVLKPSMLKPSNKEQRPTPKDKTADEKKSQILL